MSQRLRELSPIEKVFLQYLNGYSAEDLKFAVNNRTSLAKLILEFIPIHAIKVFRLIASLYRNNSQFLNTENLILWLDVTRPDLYKIIMESRENKLWLEKQLRDVRRLFGV